MVALFLSFQGPYLLSCCDSSTGNMYLFLIWGHLGVLAHLMLVHLSTKSASSLPFVLAVFGGAVRSRLDHPIWSSEPRPRPRGHVIIIYRWILMDGVFPWPWHGICFLSHQDHTPISYIVSLIRMVGYFPLVWGHPRWLVSNASPVFQDTSWFSLFPLGRTQERKSFSSRTPYSGPLNPRGYVISGMLGR